MAVVSGTKAMDLTKPRNHPTAPTKYSYDSISIKFAYSFPIYSAPYDYVTRNSHNTSFRTGTGARLARIRIRETFHF